MKISGKRMSMALIVVLLAAGPAVQAEADTQPAATGDGCSDLSSICITITNADGASQSEAIARTSDAGAWQTPCLEQPYDYRYQDDFRFIAINRITENDMTYFVADVQLLGPAYFQTALSGGKPYGRLELISALAARSHAILAVNGDDYGTQKFGTIIRNGELIRANATTRNLLIVDQNGDMTVKTDRKGEDPKSLGRQLLSENVWQTFEFGPELVRDGQAVKFNSVFDVISTNSSRREPRTAIGQIGALHYIIIIADGRQEGYSIGMTLPELQELFVRYGAQTAMNLDGGGSTELWFKGQILNRPAGGEERYVSDIIFF
jgi:exopolysaccharide biosynthesis protein